MPIIVALYFNGSKYQANGTCLVVKGVSQFVHDAKIDATGNHKGQRIFIPRSTRPPSEDGMQLPFILERRQYVYPLYPKPGAFARFVSKQQEEFLQQAGLEFRKSILLYGQLYRT